MRSTPTRWMVDVKNQWMMTGGTPMIQLMMMVNDDGYHMVNIWLYNGGYYMVNIWLIYG